MPQLTTELLATLEAKDVLPTIDRNTQRGEVAILPQLKPRRNGSGLTLGIVTFNDKKMAGSDGTLTIMTEKAPEASTNDDGMVSIRVASDCGGSWEPLDGDRTTSARPGTAAVQAIRLRPTPIPVRDFLSIVERANRACPPAFPLSKPPHSPGSAVSRRPTTSFPNGASKQSRKTSLPQKVPIKLPRMHILPQWESKWNYVGR
ncbi:uncharacterized protein SPPG_04062 [Spizellomyces punctatus DAOM BR117]|uniref:Uncharacterized protein n=1 Tax=Spizellomyces punctatus (strain DAOM BR117) TaxID=645134 RepID=A0A0L0HIV3_SPIPD|nr:uncharacterized protein SPPG_04062 [Spizellomyces punctatus DAOM BR117]KND00963.1 hypothetical protein SPPG_04062 [Spizellomyces punctatus DAOM BR117]|eukprot:XP_016609002.1 hypothetical protein SPPG_04062 [Spizellomyces punctatus DAOM BR117]